MSRGVSVNVAVGACVVPPLIGVPLLAWLAVARGASPLCLLAAPPLFGLGFLVLRQYWAYALIVANVAGLSMALGALVVVGNDWVCGENAFCFSVLSIGCVLALVLILLGIIVLSAAKIRADDAHRRAVAAREAALGRRD